MAQEPPFGTATNKTRLARQRMGRLHGLGSAGNFIALCQQVVAPNDLLPIFSATARLVKSDFLEGIGHEEQVYGRANNGVLKQAESGVAVKDLCRKHGFSDATFHK